MTPTLANKMLARQSHERRIGIWKSKLAPDNFVVHLLYVQKVVKKGRLSARKLLPDLGWQEITPTFGDGWRVTFSGR
jgi:hypothetical protein